MWYVRAYCPSIQSKTYAIKKERAKNAALRYHKHTKEMTLKMTEYVVIMLGVWFVWRKKGKSRRVKFRIMMSIVNGGRTKQKNNVVSACHRKDFLLSEAACHQQHSPHLTSDDPQEEWEEAGNQQLWMMAGFENWMLDLLRSHWWHKALVNVEDCCQWWILMTL